jgi:GxxExxY protein
MNPNGSVGIATTSRPIIEKELSHLIVGCSFEVHNEFGFGFSESVYARSLAVALEQKGVRVLRELPVTVVFRGVEVGRHRLDLLVEDRIVVEVKSMERLPELAKKQVRKYLAAARKELGLLINFGIRVESHRILGPRRQP